MIVDQSTAYGQRAAKRLTEEQTGWLTTVTASGQPKSIVVWFLWQDDESVLIYSRPDTLKLRNIRANPKVSFNLDSDGRGGNIIRLEGTAELPENHPLASEVPGYVAKYGHLIPNINMTVEEMAAAYSEAIVIRPDRMSGH